MVLIQATSVGVKYEVVFCAELIVPHFITSYNYLIPLAFTHTIWQFSLRPGGRQWFLNGPLTFSP